VTLLVAATERELCGLEGLVCGIGPVEAAAATARALALARPSALLHVGIAGGRGLAQPTLVLGSEAVYCDATWEQIPRRTAADPGYLAALRRALPAAPVLAIGTSARVGGTPPELRVEAMEGFAVLRAAALAGVPAVEVRAVSNEVAEPDRARWLIEEALEALASAIPRLLSALA
jgi:nucleoside phosphorylase